jgi:negative regulator of flagellin synthesis FlgM
MIKSVGQGLSAAVDAAKLRESGPAKPIAPVAQETTPVAAATVATPASRMAAEGAPIDLARIQRVKQAIASGNYPVDPEKIAEKMLDLDLPISRH